MGLTNGFGPKMAIFRTFFLGKIAQENVFMIFQNKQMLFQAIKTRSLKSQKIDIFSKGLWLWSKNGHFSNFFFRQYRPGKRLL